MKRYEEILAKLEDAGELTEYEQGFLAGIRLYAWMKDGTYYVGTTGSTLEQAVERFLKTQGKWPS